MNSRFLIYWYLCLFLLYIFYLILSLWPTSASCRLLRQRSIDPSYDCQRERETLKNGWRKSLSLIWNNFHQWMSILWCFWYISLGNTEYKWRGCTAMSKRTITCVSMSLQSVWGSCYYTFYGFFNQTIL